MRNKLIGELIGLARATEGNEHLISDSSTAVIVEGLVATLDNGNADNAALENLLARVEAEKRKMVPNCFDCASPCGRNNAYDMQNLWTEQEDIRSLKEQLLSDVREMAVCAHRSAILGPQKADADRFPYTALIAIGIDAWDLASLQSVVEEAETLQRKCVRNGGEA